MENPKTNFVEGWEFWKETEKAVYYRKSDKAYAAIYKDHLCMSISDFVKLGRKKFRALVQEYTDGEIESVSKPFPAGEKMIWGVKVTSRKFPVCVLFLCISDGLLSVFQFAGPLEDVRQIEDAFFRAARKEPIYRTEERTQEKEPETYTTGSFRAVIAEFMIRAVIVLIIVLIILDFIF